MKKIKFDIKEYYVLIASLIIGIPLVIFFYSVTTPKEFMGYLTFVTAFAILPIGMIYWFLSEIKSIFPGIKGLTKLRKIKGTDDEEKKESDQKEHKSHEHKEHKSHENKEEHKPHEHKEHENKEHHEKKEGSD